MYDHSNKIGNKGDLIKHFALTIATKFLVENKDSYAYLDVHSGRSSYELPDSGEWKTGIGKFAEICQSQKSLTDNLQYFCKVHSIESIPHSKKYFGSSRIILNVLQDLGITKITFNLCDTNPSVCKELQTQKHEIAKTEIHCTDGYIKAEDVYDV